MIFQQYFIQIAATVLLVLSMPVIKFFSRKLIRKYAILNKKIETRTNQVIRVFSIFINLLLFIIIIVIWGVDPHNLLVAVSSVFAVIGVALFAQWSILSNVSAGIIIFFTSPFRIGDHIRVLDHELPFDAHVEDIMSFHTLLRNREGEIISYPNSLFFQKGVTIIHIDTWNKKDQKINITE